MADRSVVVRYEARVDGYLAAVTRMQGATEKFVKSSLDTAAKHKAAWDKVGTGLTITGAAIGVAVGAAVKSFADFDKEMSNVKAVSGATAKDMVSLKSAAIQAGQATKFSASEAAQAESELAKVGISTADILGGALTGSLNLAAAGGLDLARAATVGGQAMKIFGLSGKDMGHVADVLAAGANKSAADVETLAQGLEQGGLVAKQTGLSLEDTVGTLSLFADNALKGSDAGTSLKTMLLALNPQSKEAAETMKALGLDFYDARGQFIGIEALAGQLQGRLKNLSTEQRNAALQTIFGRDAIRGANILYEQGARGVADYVKGVNDQGAAARVAAIQMDNLAGDLEQLKGSIETALIQSGSGANTVLRDMVQVVTGAVNAFGQLPSSLQGGALGLAAVSAAGLLAAGGMIKTVSAVNSARKALEELGLASKLSSAAGPLGIALAGLTIAVGLFAKSQMDAKAKADDLRGSLDQQTGAITDNTRALVAKNLQESGSLASARALGLSLKDVTDAALGNTDAMHRLNLAQTSLNSVVSALEARHGDLTQAEYDQLVAGEDQVSMFRALMKSIGATSDVLNPQITAQKEVGEAMGSAQGKATGLVQTESELADAAAKAAKAHDDLLQAVESFGQSTLNARAAARDYQAALDDASKAVQENGRTLSTNTAKGRANQAALEAIRTTALKSITANAEHSASLKSLDRQVDAARAQFIEFAHKMGMSIPEAKKLADQLGLTRGNVNQLADAVKKTPTHHSTKMDAETSAAKAKIDGLQTAINRLTGKTVYIYTEQRIRTVRESGNAGVANSMQTANQYATGNAYSTKKHKADGGYISGPGTGTSDSIPAWLSNGEFVVKAAAVSKYGTGVLHAINDMRYANGGLVGAAKFADGGEVDFSAILNIIRDVTTADDLASARGNASSKARAVTAALNALRSLQNQQRATARALRGATGSERANLLDRQRLLLGKVAAAEGKLTAARQASTAAAKNAIAVEKEYAADHRPIIDRATGAAARVNSSSKAFLDNIDKLSRMGFRTLALDLLEMGVDDAGGIAAQAAQSAAKARALQSQFTTSSAINAREAAIKAALTSQMSTATVSSTPVGATAVPAGPTTVYVQNPFTGEYLEARIDARADGRVATAAASARRKVG